MVSTVGRMRTEEEEAEEEAAEEEEEAEDEEGGPNRAAVTDRDVCCSKKTAQRQKLGGDGDNSVNTHTYIAGPASTIFCASLCLSTLSLIVCSPRRN